MNVSLYFPLFEDVKNFIMVSKRCQESINALKTNPFFINEPSFLSFLQHFSVDTVNFCGKMFSGLKQPLLDAKLIKNPNIELLLSNQSITNDEIQQIIPKITYLTLNYDDVDFMFSMGSKNADIFINFATSFSRLYSLEGDIQLIYNFLYNYTSKGTDTNVNFPKRIVFTHFQNLPIQINTSFITLLNKIKSMIRSLDETVIHVIAEFHCRDIELMKSLNGVRYYYETLSDEGCKLMDDHLVSLSGCIDVYNISDFKHLNPIIEKAWVYRINLEGIDPSSETDDWILPACVSQLHLYNSYFGSKK
ncbi:F-box domain-containing protein [Entamoeba marina]